MRTDKEMQALNPVVDCTGRKMKHPRGGGSQQDFSGSGCAVIEKNRACLPPAYPCLTYFPPSLQKKMVPSVILMVCSASGISVLSLEENYATGPTQLI